MLQYVVGYSVGVRKGTELSLPAKSREIVQHKETKAYLPRKCISIILSLLFIVINIMACFLLGLPLAAILWEYWR